MRASRMHAPATLTQSELPEFLLRVAPRRPVFIWGPPGIGKSSLVREFAASVGLPCVTLLGSQLAPEDLMGVPQILDGKSRFCPPRLIARDDAYCLFLDELNACSHEVQKAFYSLILDRRVGEYEMPRGSVVIGAGNRSQDAAIVRPMSSALMNRMVHVHLRASHQDWLAWAGGNGIHRFVLDYIAVRPDQLWVQPPKHEEPFSTPRSWHVLSDILHEYGEDIPDAALSVAAYGCLSPHHATQFRSFIKQLRGRHSLGAILAGEQRWPERPEDRDLLYFLAQSLRGRLAKELPPSREGLTASTKQLAHQAKGCLKDLAAISLEVAQMVVGGEDAEAALPDWLLVDLARDLPRLVQQK